MTRWSGLVCGRILSLALAAIGGMALVYNLSSTSGDVVVQLNTSDIQAMAASARDKMALLKTLLFNQPGEKCS